MITVSSPASRNGSSTSVIVGRAFGARKTHSQTRLEQPLVPFDRADVFAAAFGDDATARRALDEAELQ
jgi:hypothetical protein